MVWSVHDGVLRYGPSLELSKCWKLASKNTKYWPNIVQEVLWRRNYVNIWLDTKGLLSSLGSSLHLNSRVETADSEWKGRNELQILILATIHLGHGLQIWPVRLFHHIQQFVSFFCHCSFAHFLVMLSRLATAPRNPLHCLSLSLFHLTLSVLWALRERQNQNMGRLNCSHEDFEIGPLLTAVTR